MPRPRSTAIAAEQHERRQELLRILRQVSTEAAERWPRVRARDTAAEADFRSRRLAELLHNETD